MPRVEWEEITDGVCATNLGVGHWEKRFQGVQQAYQNLQTSGSMGSYLPLVTQDWWRCTYCDTSVDAKKGACTGCGAPKHRSV